MKTIEEFNKTVQRIALKAQTDMDAKIAAGKIDPEVAVCAMFVAAMNVAQVRGMGAEVAAWLRSQIPQIERMTRRPDESLLN